MLKQKHIPLLFFSSHQKLNISLQASFKTLFLNGEGTFSFLNEEVLMRKGPWLVWDTKAVKAKPESSILL